jgi:protein TonB
MTRLLLLALLACPISAAGQTLLPTEPEEICHFGAEVLPELVGGYDSLITRIVYPSDVLEAGLEGRVFLQFAVGPDGRPTEVEVIRSLDARLDEEARRVVSSAMFRWPDAVPEDQRSVWMSFPILFRISP